MVEASFDAGAQGVHVLDHVAGATLVLALEASAGMHSRKDALARVRGARRLQSYAAALEQAALLDAAGAEERVELHEIEGRLIPVHDEVVAEIALVTQQREADVRRQLTTARRLEATLPEVREALADGRIDASKATAIAQAAERLPVDAHQALQDRLLDTAASSTLGDLRAAAEMSVRALDPAGAEARAARAARRRAVWMNPDVDGNAILSARMAAADAHRCLRSITDAVSVERGRVDAAHDMAGLERPTTGMLCADELVRRLLGHATSDGATGDSAVPRITTEIQVQVDLRTLAALQDEPVVIDGVTVTDAQALRAWLADCGDVRLRRLITDPDTGRVLDCGTGSYTPGVPLRRFIVARDGRCIWPGCSEPAVDCDIDHAIPWEQGGATDRDNLNALCRPHHILKTLYGYRLERDETGEWLLITPTGEIVASSHSVNPVLHSARSSPT